MKVILDWIKKYLAPIVILGLCTIGFFGLTPFGYGVSAKMSFAVLGIGYAIFHVNGFWDMLKGWWVKLSNKLFNKEKK